MDYKNTVEGKEVQKKIQRHPIFIPSRNSSGTYKDGH